MVSKINFRKSLSYGNLKRKIFHTTVRNGKNVSFSSQTIEIPAESIVETETQETDYEIPVFS